MIYRTGKRISAIALTKHSKSQYKFWNEPEA